MKTITGTITSIKPVQGKFGPQWKKYPGTEYFISVLGTDQKTYEVRPSPIINGTAYKGTWANAQGTLHVQPGMTIIFRANVIADGSPTIRTSRATFIGISNPPAESSTVQDVEKAIEDYENTLDELRTGTLERNKGVQSLLSSQDQLRKVLTQVSTHLARLEDHIAYWKAKK